MLKKSNQEQLRKRLDSLFTELAIEIEHGSELPVMSMHTNNTGWMWRCDSDGVYVECSPEVQAILDYLPEDFVGKQFREFALEATSSKLLKDALAIGNFPMELGLQFRSKYDSVINVSFIVMADDAKNGDVGGFRGFAQIQREWVDVPQQDNQSHSAEQSQDQPDPEVVTAVNTIPLESTALAYQDTATLDPSAVIEYLASNEGENISPTPTLLEPTKLDLLEIIDSDPNREWSQEELLLVEQVADQLALALDKAKLFNQTQDALSETDEQARRLKLLNEMSEDLSQVMTLEDILEITARYIDVILSTDLSSISVLFNVGELMEVYTLNGANGAARSGSHLPVAGNAIAWVVEERKLLNIPDLEKDNDNIDSKKLLEQGVNSSLISPLIVSGKVFGTLNCGSYTPNHFSKTEENLITNISTIISSTIENRQLFDAVQGALADSEEQSRRLKLLNAMSEQISQADNVEEVGHIAVTKTLEILNGSMSSIVQVDNILNSAKILAAAGEESTSLPGSKLELTGSLLEAIRRKRVIIDEAESRDESSQHSSTLIAPIISGGQVIWVLDVKSSENTFYTSADQNMISQIVSLVGGTLENNRLFAEIQQRSAQMQASAQVSSLASGILDSAELLQKVIEAIRQGFDFYYAGIFLVDQEGDWTGEAGKWAVLQAGTGEPGRQMLAAGHKLELGGESMIGSAIANAQARIALDVGEEAVFFRNPYLPNTRSEMALPLIARGITVGALTIQSTEEAAFSQEDITALQTMADQVANSIENVNLFEQTQERAEELSVLNEMARSFTQTLEIEIILENIYLYTSRLMDARNFFVAFYDQDVDEVHFPLYKYHGDKHEDQGVRRKSGNGITEWVIKNRKPLLLRDNAIDWIKEQNLDIPDFDAKSWLGVPMLRGEDVIGVIAVQSYSTSRKYSTHHLDLLSAVASQAGIAIENASLFQQTQARALVEQERATQERLVRTITERVRGGEDIQSILRITVEEVSQAIGANKSAIRLGTREQLLNVESGSNGIDIADHPAFSN